MINHRLMRELSLSDPRRIIIGPHHALSG